MFFRQTVEFMREIKLENINPVEEITNKLWSLFDILRSESISSADYYLVLFLLALYKDGYLDYIQNAPNDYLRQEIESRLKDSNAEYNGEYYEISKAFDSSFKRISNTGLYAIIEVLSKTDQEILKEYFPEIFDNLLFRIAKSQGRSGGEFIQPIELTRLVCDLAELPANSTVFNPFAGVASFGVLLEEGQTYFGQEINYTTWAIGALRLLSYERPGHSRYVNDNSIIHWPNDNQKFDLIVSNPSYGLKLGDSYRDISPEFRTAEQFLIEKGISSLNNEGKLIAILPIGFLFRSGYEQRLREHLVESDLLDTIISLPGGLLLNTGIPLVILVINKTKRKPGVVKFIDARQFVEPTSSREKKLNTYGLYSIISNGRESDFIKIVPTQQIREYDYNLNVPRYFQKVLDGVKLSDILQSVHGPRIPNGESGRLVKIRDLKDDKLDYFLDEKSIEEVKTARPNTRLVEESALLVASRWKTLKPTFFKYTGTAILLPPDIIAFRVNESLANVAYLINELHSDYIQEQLDSYRLGDTIPFIRRDDLLEIKVRLLPLNEQIAKVQGIEELSSKIKYLQQERNALAHGRSASQFNEFASLKHTLGRPRQNILDWADNLLHFLGGKGLEIEQLNNSFAEFYDIDMISALNEIKRDVNFMSEILEKGENGLVLEDYPIKLMPLSDVNAIVNMITHNGFNFKLKKLPLKGEKLKGRGIECNPTLLKTLIDNILTNANKHGFIKKDSTNEVVIELIEVDDTLIFDIRNNGKPFSRHYDKEKFISKYSTANPELGSGLGGYDINRIAEYFNDSNWELILNEDPIYPVKFKFHFPIKLVK